MNASFHFLLHDFLKVLQQIISNLQCSKRARQKVYSHTLLFPRSCHWTHVIRQNIEQIKTYATNLMKYYKCSTGKKIKGRQRPLDRDPQTETPLDRDPPGQEVTSYRKPPPVVRQMPMEILPCPKLPLRAVAISGGSRISKKGGTNLLFSKIFPKITWK